MSEKTHNSNNKRVNEALWAKKKEEQGALYWLPLAQHLEDTKDIAGLLWEHWLSDGQRTFIEDSLDTKSQGLGKNLLLFLAAVHDIGKATPAFQTMSGFSRDKDLNACLLEKLERAGFDGISTLSLQSPKSTRHAIAGEYLLSTYGVGDDIGSIIGAHHGKPVDIMEEYKCLKSYTANYFQAEDRESTVYQKWDKAQQDIFTWALATSGFNDPQDLPTIRQPAQVLLLGLLIMADWIASNEDYFPLFAIGNEIIVNPVRRSQAGFKKWKKGDTWKAECDADFTAIYKTRFRFIPNNVQAVFAETVAGVENPGIFIFEAPMGIGKTEAALVACEQLASQTGRSGIFFGLPTQATSDGIFPRIESWLHSINSDTGDNLQLRLSHGKAYLNERFLSLARNINADDAGNGSVIVNEWFSGKKTASLDDFVVGTVDQFLLSALKQKHLALRHLGFSRKVVVIDEVHAYDAYMNQYLMEAIRWMGAYGVPVVILSATLPEAKRIELLKHYMLGMGKEWTKAERAERNQVLKITAYPLITYNDGEEVYQVRDFAKIENKRVQVVRLDEDRLIDTVSHMISEGGIVGIVVNTVRRAQKIARQLVAVFGEEQVELFHSGFIATARKQKEQNLLEMIGKNARRPFSKIIVGTQVIEQSLDIDFDVMISDLAPMDLLLQRIGRLHRHFKTKRPSQHAAPILYVLGTNEDMVFAEGSSAVYGDYLLARTQYFLPDTINMPADISILVQKVYSEEVEVALPDDLSEKYLASNKKHKRKVQVQKNKAKAYRIAGPVLKKANNSAANLIGWLKNPTPDDCEETAYAQVRDINDTIEVIALKKVGNGYGLFGEEVDLSEKIGDFHVEKEIAKHTLRLPNFQSSAYPLDKTIKALEANNLKVLNQWQQSSWLKGSLGMIFNENNEFYINDCRIIYSEKYGIEMERRC